MTSELYLLWKNLEYSVAIVEDYKERWKFWKTRKEQKTLQILKPTSGCLKTGNLVAILGASGAGKTTLLAAISQRLRGNVNGEILLNGLRIDRNEMTNISSFLPQYNISVRKLTAFEHLYFMTHFKIAKSVRKNEKVQKVNGLLEKVGLTDSANTRIEHLSGGERKRLSLAEELITDPPFVFCDEPTTGLDSYNAFSVIKTLRKLTHPGKKFTSSSNIFSDDNDDDDMMEMEIFENDEAERRWASASIELQQRQNPKGVICSIHQPTSEVFELFTHIILMDNGQMIYQGSTDDACIFFSKLGFYCPQNCNPADFFLKLISSSADDENSRNKCAEIIRNNYEQEIPVESYMNWDYLDPDSLSQVNKFAKISWFYQVYLIISRSTIEARRNLYEIFISSGLCLCTAITLSIMYSSVTGYNQITVQDITGSLFMVTSELVFTSSYSHCYMFSALLPILRRETGEGTYNLSAYYVATILFLIPKAFILSYLFFGIVFIGVSFDKGFVSYLFMSFTLALSGLTGTAYGIFMSSLFESDVLAAEMAAPFDFIFLVFGGIYYNVNSIPLLKYISLFYFVNEALMYIYWNDVDQIECQASENQPCLRNGTEVLERYSFNTEPLTVLYDYIGLIVIFLIFHFIAFVKLRRFVKRVGYF